MVPLKKTPNQREPLALPQHVKVKAKSTTPSNLERQDSNAIILQNFYHIQTTKGLRGPLIILTLHPIKKHKPTNTQIIRSWKSYHSETFSKSKKKRKALHRSWRESKITTKTTATLLN